MKIYIQQYRGTQNVLATFHDMVELPFAISQLNFSSLFSVILTDPK
jgi:hypothetical protein